MATAGRDSGAALGDSLCRPTGRKALTHRQELVLGFIRASIASLGYAPSLREICVHIGTTSTNGANDHLLALERKGYIIRDPLKSRATKLVAVPNRPREGLAQLRKLASEVRRHPSDRLADALDHVIVMYMQRYPETVQ
jgi:SOS-response transcriptional repressor LexA